MPFHLSGWVLAAPLLHLAALLQQAREANPDLLAASAQVRAAQSLVAPAAALDDPMLMLQLWNAPADFSTAPVMLQLSQNVPLGGKLASRKTAAEADVQVARATRDSRERDVEADVARAYFDLFLADRTIDIDTEMGRTLHDMLEATTVRVAAGTGDSVDELKAQQEILKLTADAETAQAQRASANARLAVLVQQDPSQLLGKPALPAPLALPSVESLGAQALDARPELNAAAAMIAGAEAQRRLMQAARVPDLGVSAAAMYQFGGTGEHTFLFAGVQGNLPIFEGTKTQPHIDAADARIESLRHMQQSLRNRVLAEVATAYAQVTSEGRLVALHHQLVPLSRRTLEAALTSYGAGRGTFLTVLDSEREIQMHEIDLAAHLAAYEQHLVELERAVGKDLGLVASAEAGGDASHEGGHR